MINDLLSKTIKEYRLKNNLTQKELANEICAQSIISKIEKEGVFPTIDIFINIVKKLNIPTDVIINLFGLEPAENNYNYFININKIKDLLEKRDYETIKIIIDNIKDINSISKYEFFFFKYVNAVIHNNNKIELLENTINEMKQIHYNNKDLFSRIYLALAGLYMEKEEYQISHSYIKKIENYIDNTSDSILHNKYYYTYARLCSFTDKNKLALDLANKGIELSVSNGILRFLGDLIILKSSILCDEKMYEESLVYCEQALIIFNINNNFKMIDFSLQLKKFINDKIKYETK